LGFEQRAVYQARQSALNPTRILRLGGTGRKGCLLNAAAERGSRTIRMEAQNIPAFLVRIHAARKTK